MKKKNCKKVRARVAGSGARRDAVVFPHENNHQESKKPFDFTELTYNNAHISGAIVAVVASALQHFNHPEDKLMSPQDIWPIFVLAISVIVPLKVKRKEAFMLVPKKHGGLSEKYPSKMSAMEAVTFPLKSDCLIAEVKSKFVKSVAIWSILTLAICVMPWLIASGHMDEITTEEKSTQHGITWAIETLISILYALIHHFGVYEIERLGAVYRDYLDEVVFDRTSEKPQTTQSHLNKMVASTSPNHNWQHGQGTSLSGESSEFFSKDGDVLQQSSKKGCGPC